MDCLVGFTGFVGSNLVKNHEFDNVYNSENIEKAFNTYPNSCIYAGIPAEKFLANQYPEKDKIIVDNAIENIKKINPKQLIIISTIDVYKNSYNVNESSKIDTDGLHPYGFNRYRFENWARENFEDCLIVRLPAIFGHNIKKNFIYDLINVIPSMLNYEKFNELIKIDNLISEYYDKLENGFYKCTTLKQNEKVKLKDYFENIGFSAINFTDSRASFPFYNLKYLWEHIQISLENKINLVNLAVEPLTAMEIYKNVKGKDFKNEITVNIPCYNIKTNHAEIFGGSSEYIFNKEKVLLEIKDFVEGYK